MVAYKGVKRYKCWATEDRDVETFEQGMDSIPPKQHRLGCRGYPQEVETRALRRSSVPCWI